MEYDDLLLVPRPQYLELRGTGAELSTPAREQLVGTLPAEGFELEISAGAVDLRYGDDAGRRYGQALLDQIRAQ